MSTVEELPLPDDLRACIPGREQLLDQTVTVETSPWRHEAALRELPAPTGPFHTHPEVTITRRDVYAAAGSPINDGSAFQLLYLSLAWAAGDNPGTAMFGLEPTHETTAVLLDAWRNARDGLDPVECYTRLTRRTHGEKLLRLSPARLTSFLMFAQGDDVRGRCVPLDAPTVLGLGSLGAGSVFSRRTDADLYGRYCRLIARWADEASTADRDVRADQVQAALATLGRASAALT
ncbi:hypothetical protein [Nocardioides sp.]|uniref:8-oxoguanine DNA glycosylase OGG fold protein n=1 Tax=Nocardioides sp. TaxID=35761 RepID=UPI0027352F3B|nr:hypothetical protein [Nocardioides sp.]MDP3890493.1 hypothetical protein [Nocardioides sp.]